MTVKASLSVCLITMLLLFWSAGIALLSVLLRLVLALGERTKFNDLKREAASSILLLLPARGVKFDLLLTRDSSAWWADSLLSPKCSERRRRLVKLLRSCLRPVELPTGVGQNFNPLHSNCLVAVETGEELRLTILGRSHVVSAKKTAVSPG